MKNRLIVPILVITALAGIARADLIAGPELYVISSIALLAFIGIPVAAIAVASYFLIRYLRKQNAAKGHAHEKKGT